MEKSPADKYSKGFLTLVAILLTFLLLLTAIWLWYDLRMAALDKAREEKEQSSSHITP